MQPVCASSRNGVLSSLMTHVSEKPHYGVPGHQVIGRLITATGIVAEPFFLPSTSRLIKIFAKVFVFFGEFHVRLAANLRFLYDWLSLARL